MKFPPPFYRWRPHPWHGLDTGSNPPEIVHAYIEITPFDFLHPWVPKPLIGLVDTTGRLIEKIPALREIAGSLIIVARKH